MSTQRKYCLDALIGAALKAERVDLIEANTWWHMHAVALNDPHADIASHFPIVPGPSAQVPRRVESLHLHLWQVCVLARSKEMHDGDFLYNYLLTELDVPAIITPWPPLRKSPLQETARHGQNEMQVDQ